VLSYLWFPFMVIPVYAGFERLPSSLLEASTDLGAKAGRTFASVVLPQMVPSIVAGSIFTFALTLGDFYMNRIVGGTTEFLGNIVYRQFSVDLPFAAAYSTVPILIMVIYLLTVRRTGALDEL
jgi:putative spermidine/putrescine transport system permease protein